MKQLIELGAVRIGAAIQNVYANVDFDVLSLPGGSLIAAVLWFYASAASSMRCATTRVRATGTTLCGARACCVSPAAIPFSASSLIARPTTQMD
jgi:hypothetical protein